MVDNRREEFKDFRAFLWYCLDFLGGFRPTDTQVDIANELQRNHPKLVIHAQRGVGKSWVLAIYVLWRLYWDPTINVLIVSASEGKALEHTTMILRMMAECEEFQHMHPSRRVVQDEFEADALRKSVKKFDVADAPISQAPSVRAAGITGQITGSRASLIVADDIETKDNAYTREMREKLKKQVEEFVHIAKPEGCEIIFLGTPQCEETIYATLPDNGYRVMIWPAQYPLAEQMSQYGDKLAPSLRKMLAANPKLQEPVHLGPFEPDGGKATDRRFPEQVLLNKRIGSGRSGYRLQYMLNPTAANAEKFPLRLRDLIVFDAPDDMAPPTLIHSTSQERTVQLPNPGFRSDALFECLRTQGDFVPYEDGILYVDPSGRGADETAYVVLKRLNGYLFLLKAGGFSDGYGPETLRKLADLARRYKVKRVITEDNFGDGMFRTLLLPVLQEVAPGIGIEGVKVSAKSGHKMQRVVESLEPVVSAHRLVVHSDVFREDAEPVPGRTPEEAVQYRLWWQFTRATKERDCIPHDDRVDALAGAVAVFQTALSVRQDVNSDKLLRRAKDAEVAAACREAGMTEYRRTWGSEFLGMAKIDHGPMPEARKDRRRRRLSVVFPI